MGGHQWEVVGGKASGGILVRAGKATSSSEVLPRLATGSVVDEVEVIGERLHFRLLQGAGPAEGWVSISMKGTPLLVERHAGAIASSAELQLPTMDDAIDLEVGSALPFADRPYHIILHGATGFTGMLAVQHMDALMQQPGREKMRWAIAGRSRERLQEVKKMCKTPVGVIEATTEQEVVDMIGNCQVVLAGAGPYARCGEVVIRACVGHGTHYVDYSGETWWLKHMVAKYGEEARTRGVILVNMCGMQSTPNDVGTRMLVEKLGPLRRVRTYIMQFAATTGGTDFSGRTAMEALIKHPQLYTDFVDPFNLGGRRGDAVRDIDEDCATPDQDDICPKIWGGAVGCATVDSRCIRRSCHLFEEARGDRRLQYGSELAVAIREPHPSKRSAQTACSMFGRLPSAEAARPALEGMTRALAEGGSAKVGMGPDASTREQFYTKYFIVAEAEDGKFATCRYDGGEPYEVTAMTSVTAALVLAESHEAMKPQDCGGFVTPAYAFQGTNFTELLQSNRWAAKQNGASMRWEIAEGKPDQQELEKLMTERSKNYVTKFAELNIQALPDYVA